MFLDLRQNIHDCNPYGRILDKSNVRDFCSTAIWSYTDWNVFPPFMAEKKTNNIIRPYKMWLPGYLCTVLTLVYVKVCFFQFSYLYLLFPIHPVYNRFCRASHIFIQNPTTKRTILNTKHLKDERLLYEYMLLDIRKVSWTHSCSHAANTQTSIILFRFHLFFEPKKKKIVLL